MSSRASRFRTAAAGGVFFCTVLYTVAAAGQSFRDPHLIDTLPGQTDRVAMAVDPTGEVRLAVSVSGSVYQGEGRGGFEAFRVVAKGGAEVEYEAPDITINAGGVSFIAFSTRVSGTLRQISWTANPGGLFRAPELVPGSEALQLSQPQTFIAPDGEIVICWSGKTQENESFLYFSRSGGHPTKITRGERGCFALDSEGWIHAAYVRDGDLYYATNRSGGFEANEVRLTESEAAELPLSLTLTPEGRPVLLYGVVQGGAIEPGAAMDIYLTAFPWEEAFEVGKQVVLESGACIAGIKEERIVIAEVEGGEIWVIERDLQNEYDRIRVCRLQGEETGLQGGIDRFGYVHLVFLRSGVPLYTNNAPPPRAAFTASPTRGEVPLTVSFSDFSTGHIIRRLWDFGDGKISTSREPEHTYEEPGTYTVALTVYGPGGAVDRKELRGLITVEPKKNRLRVSDVVVYAGQKEVLIPLRVTNDRPLTGFQIAGVYEPDKLSLHPDRSAVNFHLTVCETLEPEFVAARVVPEEGYFTVGVILDINSPITGKAVPTNRDMNLINLVADIPSDLPDGTTTTIALTDGMGDPPISNTFTVGNATSVHPKLIPGKVTVLRRDQSFQGEPFVRGDPNEDGKIDIADCIYILGYLFSQGEAPRCLDSADLDDNGRINIADAIFVLTFMLRFEVAPPFPFPSEGLDPTEDGLPPCKS